MDLKTREEETSQIHASQREVLRLIIYDCSEWEKRSLILRISAGDYGYTA